MYNEYSEEICGHCKHHKKDGFEWICMNEESIASGEYTAYDESCEDFEERRR